MIELVLDSYYRQGSTILFKILELSNPDKIVLCEPFHEGLFKILKKVHVGTIDPLHKIPIWDGYFKLSKNILTRLEKIHTKVARQCPFIINFNDVKEYLDILHEIDKSIIFKSVRAYFILDKIKRRYNCKTIHIVRNPANTWIDFLHTSITDNEELFWKVTTTNYLWNDVSGSFYLGDLYEAIRKYFDLPKARTNYERFITCWVITNYHGIINSDVQIIYECVLYKRERYFKYLNMLLGKNYFDLKYSHLPDAALALKHQHRVSRLRILMYRILYEFGLEKYYKTIYEKAITTLSNWQIPNKWY